LGAGLCTLEGHMLQEVSSTVVLVGFVNRASINVDSNGGGFTRTVFGSDSQTTWELSDLSRRSLEQVLRQGRASGGGGGEVTANSSLEGELLDIL